MRGSGRSKSSDILIIVGIILLAISVPFYAYISIETEVREDLNNQVDRLRGPPDDSVADNFIEKNNAFIDTLWISLFIVVAIGVALIIVGFVVIIINRNVNNSESKNDDSN